MSWFCLIFLQEVPERAGCQQLSGFFYKAIDFPRLCTKPEFVMIYTHSCCMCRWNSKQWNKAHIFPPFCDLHCTVLCWTPNSILYWVFSTDFCNLEIVKILLLTSKQTNKPHQNQNPPQKTNKQKNLVPDSNSPKNVYINFLKTKVFSHVFHWHKVLFLDCEICATFEQ